MPVHIGAMSARTNRDQIGHHEQIVGCISTAPMLERMVTIVRRLK
jgi:hypothetical protein